MSRARCPSRSRTLLRLKPDDLPSTLSPERKRSLLEWTVHDGWRLTRRKRCDAAVLRVFPAQRYPDGGRDVRVYRLFPIGY